MSTADSPTPPHDRPLADEVSGRLMEHWAAGERVPVEHFLLHNPTLAADPEVVLELVLLEAALREDRGDPAPLPELVVRFPGLAAQLRLQAAFRAGLRGKPREAGARPDGADPGAGFAISGYEIGREIGRGGMAMVYEARQLSLNRRVALKMMTIGVFSGEHQQTRLRTEAEAVSRLQHPNVVQIYEVGLHNGQPFLALELVEGGTLADRLRNGPISPPAAAALIETLARAVHAVHERGIVHRDLKPANVLFTQPADGAGSEVPKLTDFGLAKLVDGTSHPTRTGETLGTPGYMAPEQVAGGGGVGPTVDVYGLGAILYECLTGQQPFRGATVAEALFRVSQDDPLPPSRLRPGIPRDLQTICLKCLEKSPGRRYPTAADLAADLGRFARGEPVRARPLGLAGRAWKHARRYPLVAGLLIALAATVVAGLAGVTWKWRESAQLAVREASQREKAESNLYRSRVSQAAMLWQSNNLAAAKEQLSLCVPELGQPDLRGWEWNYLARLFNPETATLPQRCWVRDVAVSPDGQELAVACGDPPSADGRRNSGEVAIWDLRTYQPIRRLDGDETVAVAYSPDGRHVAAATSGGAVRLIERGTWRDRFVWQEGQGPVRLSFHPDGRRLVILGAPPDGLIVRDVATGAKVTPQDVMNAWPVPPAYSPDGRRVLGFGPGKPLGLTEIVAGLGAPSEFGIQSATLVGPDRLVAVGAGGITTWDLGAKREPHRLFGHVGMVCAVAASPDGKVMATGGADHTIRLWDAKTTQEKLVLRGHTWAVQALAFTPDGNRLISGGQDRTVKIWDLTRDPRGRLFPSAGWVNAVAVAPEGQVRVSTTDRFRSWSVIVGRQTADVHAADVTRRLRWPRNYAEFFPDGRRVLSLCDSTPSVLKAWDAETGEERVAFRGHTAGIGAVAVSPDGRWTASAGWGLEAGGREIRVWDAVTGETRAVIETPFPVASLALSPDGRRLAVGGIDTSSGGGVAGLTLWDIDARAKIGEVNEHREFVTSLAFSPDGRRLASVGFLDQQLFLIDASDGRVLHRSTVIHSPTCVAYHPSGRRLAVIGYEGIVSLRDGDDGAEIFRLPGLIGNQKGDTASNARVRFSPDGSWLVSTNWDGSLNLWDGR